MRLLFATTNQGKLVEARQILRDVEVLSLDDFSQLKDLQVEEIGDTFRDNALIKAKAYGDLAGILTVAEDAGMAVGALDGRPGVHSARYAPTDKERNVRVLAELSGFTNRAAQFISALCLYDPATQKTEYFEGIVHGMIADQEKGEDGFGFDPIFIPEGYSQTFGELGREVKNELSHRAQVFRKLREYLLAS